MVQEKVQRWAGEKALEKVLVKVLVKVQQSAEEWEQSLGKVNAVALVSQLELKTVASMAV